MILRNQKQEHFAQLVAKGVNNTEAAKQSGYSEKTATAAGSRLFRKAQIKARIQELRERGAEQAVNDLAIDKSWILRKLVDIVERTTGENRFQGSVANKALELLGKELGMFNDSIPREIFNLMLAQMGTVVALHVTDGTILDRITEAWSRISVATPQQIRAGKMDNAGSDRAIDYSN